MNTTIISTITTTTTTVADVPVVKPLTLGVHAVLVSDVESPSGILPMGTKVFVSSLSPLAVSTTELSGIEVPREAIKTTKGRPRKIVAAAPVAATAATVAEPQRDLSVDGVMGPLTIEEVLAESTFG
jgi:hypothetical protein